MHPLITKFPGFTAPAGVCEVSAASLGAAAGDDDEAAIATPPTVRARTAVPAITGARRRENLIMMIPPIGRPQSGGITSYDARQYPLVYLNPVSTR